MVNGVGRLPPYHFWGYGEDGNKNRDPNSQRSIAKDEKETKEKTKQERAIPKHQIPRKAAVNVMSLWPR